MVSRLEPAFCANTVVLAARGAHDVLHRDAEEAGVGDVAAQHVRCPLAVPASSAGRERDLLRAHADAHGPVAGVVADAAAAGARRRAPSASTSRDVAPSRPTGLASIRFESRGSSATNSVARPLVELRGGRRAARSCPSLITAIASAIVMRLLLVVRDVDERDADLLLDVLELDLQLPAQAQVQRAERLVEQQRARAVDERAGERDALLLAAGELRRACARASGASSTSSSASATRRLTSALATLRALEPEGDVLLDVRCGNSA